MNSRKSFCLAVGLLGTFAAGVILYCTLTGAGQADTSNVVAKGKGGEPLPIRHVVLFNSGLGYFQREGEVDGNTRVELSFPTGDINDLLKSLVLQDPKGKIGTVNYDSSDPIDKILRSFALDLTGNPTFGQILNQARGEKIEISRSEKKDGASVKLPGVIIGMEMQKRPILPSLSGIGVGGEGVPQILDVEVLNLNTATGLQAIPMDQIVAVRFQNPTLENEFQRALQVLARSHDTLKKTVSVGFNGEGKRPVKVGYVVERPIWKTTYRLRIDPKDRVFLQGWALVENTSDDDWNDVRMVLVSGKPISFRMNLYDPIYVPRPLVEPELFASLRPPVYSGALDKPLANNPDKISKAIDKLLDPQKSVQHITDLDKSIDKQQLLNRFGEYHDALVRLKQRLARGTNEERNRAQALEGVLRDFRGNWNDREYAYMVEILRAAGAESMDELSLNAQNEKLPRTLRKVLDKISKDSPPKDGDGNGDQAPDGGKPGKASKNQADSIKKLEEAKKKGGEIAGFNFKEGIASVATADEVGDYFQYLIDQKISLPRQKSAMLPILDQTIEGHKFSIYNESIHAKYPLLGLKLKNTSGQPLTQGPITVYDGGVFGGDTRILDLQPNEERLLSYALDQGTEVKTEVKQTPSPDMTFTIGSEHLSAKYDVRQTRTYTIKNRSTHDRQVLIEHPLRSDWKLVEPKKPIEQTRDVYRFQVSAPAGKTVSIDVVEDSPQVDNHGRRSNYAIAAGVNVKVETTIDYHKLTGLRIEKGFVEPTYKTRETKAYFVQNLSDIDRTFKVDHVVRPGWVRLDDKNKPQAGPEVFRFKLAVAKEKTGQQEVREERTLAEKGTLLKSLTETQVKDYLASNVMSAEVKAAFKSALTMQAKIGETQKQIADAEKQLTVLTADHTRVRENLKIIPMTSEHYKTFLEKFVAQDKQIESLQKNVRDLNVTLQDQIREYDQYLAKLDAE